MESDSLRQFHFQLKFYLFTNLLTVKSRHTNAYCLINGIPQSEHVE